MLQPSGSSRVRALVAACMTACAACSTAPVFGEAAGGAGTTTSGPTTGSSTTSAGPSTSSQGGAGDGGQGGDGAGGGGAAGLGGAGGQGGEGGAGCVSDCGERRCGVDACGDPCGPASDTWAITVGQSVARVLLHAGSSSLYVIGDRERIDVVDTCLGESLASRDVVQGGYLRGAGVIGDELVVGVNDETAMDVALRLDRATLLASRDPIPLPASLAGLNDRLWSGVAHDGALWLSIDDDADSLVRVDPGSGQATRLVAGTPDELAMGRGIASTPFGLVHQGGDLSLRLVNPDQCQDGTCAAVPSAPLEARGFHAAYGDGWAYVPSFESGHGRVMRVAIPSMEVGPTVQRDVDAQDDGFLDAAFHDGVVYVSGAVGGLEGLPWVVAFPPDFQTLTAPLAEAVIEGMGDIGWTIAVDDGGVYVAGSRAGGGGFVVKCTHALVCPSIPDAPVEK